MNTLQNRKVKKSPVEDYDKSDYDMYEKIVETNMNKDELYDEIKKANFVDGRYYLDILLNLPNTIDVKTIEYIISNTPPGYLSENLNKVIDEYNRFEEVMLILVDYVVDVNSQDEKGKTMLNKACKLNQSNLVEKLLERGADQLIKDNYDRLPLHRAYRSYDCFNALIENLLDRHIDPLEVLCMKRKGCILGNSETQSVTNACFFFSTGYQCLDLRILKLIFEIDPELVSYTIGTKNLKCSKNPKVTSMALFSTHNYDVCEFLIEKGADINGILYPKKGIIDENYIRTILSYACYEVRAKFIPLLSREVLEISLYNYLGPMDMKDDNILVDILERIHNPKFSYLFNLYKSQPHINKSTFVPHTMSRFFSITKTARLMLDCESINLILKHCNDNDMYYMEHDFAKLLLDCGMDANARYGNSENELENKELIMFFMIIAEVDIIEVFLSKGVDLNNETKFPDERQYDGMRMTPMKVLTDELYISLYSIPEKHDSMLRRMKELLNMIYENNWHFHKKKLDQTLVLLSDPVTLQLYEDPLIASDGNTYSRSTLERLFQWRTTAVSPLNRSEMYKIDGDVGVPNLHMRMLVDKFTQGEIAIY